MDQIHLPNAADQQSRVDELPAAQPRLFRLYGLCAEAAPSLTVRLTRIDHAGYLGIISIVGAVFTWLALYIYEQVSTQ
jgi:hypothetical protein